MVVDCGWLIVTEPLGAAQVPTPGIVMLTPVPELSVTDQDKVTVAVPPIVTDDGDAVNEFMVGAGHAFTLTVAS